MQADEADENGANNSGGGGGDGSSSGDKAIFKGVRTSKYRHVYGEVARKDQCYDNVNITKNAHDSNFCAVNPKFVAIVVESYGGGSFIVIPVDRVGRIDVHADRVSGHKGKIYDIKWNPFNDNIIASCSDDATVKVWHITDGGSGTGRNLNQPLMDLRQHQRRVNFLEWHPVAENILLSAGQDHLIVVWNLARAAAVRVIDCHPDAIHSMSFNRDGSLLATTCKDKQLRIISMPDGQVIQEGQCHHGTKASKVVFMGDSERLFTVGFSRYSDRQWAVWSQHNLQQPLTIENIDSSSGVLFPFYDADTRMVYVAGKGDGNIRYYETTDESPYCHYLSQFLSGNPQRGLGVMPKRGLDVYRCEVFRFYKLHATKQMVEPISMIVPRKSETFQADIFPDTAAPTAALTAEQWLAGERRNPILFNLKTGVGAKTNKPLFVKPATMAMAQGKTPTMSECNIERKYEFISQVSAIDYREKPAVSNQINHAYHHQVNEPQPPPPPTTQTTAQVKKTNGLGSRKPSKESIKSTKSMHSSSSSTSSSTKNSPIKAKKMKNGQDKPLVNNYLQKSSSQSSSSSSSKLPWVKDNEVKSQRQDLVCDIVSSTNGSFRKIAPPQAVLLVDSAAEESDESMANSTEDSITEEIILSSIKYDNNGYGRVENGSIMNANHVGGSQDSNLNESSDSTYQSPSSSDSNGLKRRDSTDSDNISLNPKNERELWTVFQEQRALIHKLRAQLVQKDARIDELEDLISNLNAADLFVAADNGDDDGPEEATN